MENWKTQEAKYTNIIHSYTHFIAWCVLLGPTFVYIELTQYFYVVEIRQYVSLICTHHDHAYLPIQSPKTISILITKNTLHQPNQEKNQIKSLLSWCDG